MNYISNKKIKDMTKKHLFQNGLALFVCLFLFAGAVFAQTQTEVVQVKNDDTWTVPSDVHVTSVTFEAWGGGGAGGFTTGGHDVTDLMVSGGGGGGAYGKTTINNPTAGEVFTITVGAGGYNTADDDNSILCPLACYKNHRWQNGGTSTVKRGTTTILEALGGNTCSGIDNLVGAEGGAATGAGDLHYAGGKGGNASYDCPESIWPYAQLAGRRSTGSGGGAAGPNGNGGAAQDATCSANGGWQAGGTAGGGFAGRGGEGTSDHNDVLGGKPVGNPGLNYGGGGAGSKTWRSWHSGGNGAPGIVVITYTYVNESITVEDAEEYLCSNATGYTSYNIPLNIQASGFQVKDANPNNISYDNIVAETGLDYTTPTISYNQDLATWYISGQFRNNTNNTLTLTIPATAFAPSGTVWDEYTVTIHAYGKLNGGLIKRDQYLCYQQEVSQLVNVASATGGKNSANPTYQWSYSNSEYGTYTPIDGATNEYYTPTQTGSHLFYKRAVVDECGTAYAHDNDYQLFDNVEIVNPNPMDPGMIEEESPTICGNEPFNETIYSHFSGAIPVGSYGIEIYWQRKVNDGDWEYIPGAMSTGYVVGLTPGDGLMVPGNVIQYRYMVSLMEGGYATCERVPSNNVYTVRVGGLTDYTGQFPDKTITLWYGACDTSIANLTAPVLDPTPVSITRVDNIDRVGVEPGEYTITWSVVADDCGGAMEYNQTVKVEYPKCGTLEEPYIVKDLEGNEYNTIRIGCECWLAENLRTSAPNASYYNDDDANENFGRLYNWNDAIGDNNAVMETKLGTTYIEGVCPVGWAIPTVAQYNTMMSNVEGVDAIKSDDQSTWLPGNAGTNAAGFAAMGAGYYEAMQYQRQLGYTYFWTADLNPSNNTVAKVMELRCGCDELTCTEKNKEAKVSVRCVKVEPLSYAMINIAFDMHDDGTGIYSGWDGGYILVEYGSSQVLMTVSHEQNVCQLPVPKGSDVTLTWSSWVYDGDFDDQVSFTVTNEETGEVLATSENLQEGVIANFHVKGKSVPEDFQNVEFILNDSYGDQWNGGAMLQVNYGSGILNLTESDTEGYFDYHNLVALPVGSHIILNWVPGTYDEEISIRVKYEGSSDVLYEATEPAAGQFFEFDVEKQ